MNDQVRRALSRNRSLSDKRSEPADLLVLYDRSVAKHAQGEEEIDEHVIRDLSEHLIGFFGEEDRMTFARRSDVEDRHDAVGFENDVGFSFSSSDTREDALGHTDRASLLG